MTRSLGRIEPHGLKAAGVPAKRSRRAMGIQQALEWAFGREFASLDLDVIDPENDRGPAVSLEWVIAQRAALGCSIDGSTGGGWGGSAPHRDAEVIAAFVANLSKDQGGRWMATRIAALARAGITPDWMPDATPRLVARGWRNTKHGPFAETEIVERVETAIRGRVVKVDWVACPLVVRPTAAQIHAARGFYLDWWSALLHLSGELRRGGMLDDIELTDAMPPMTPWRRANA